MVKIDSPMFDNPLGKTPPSVDEDNAYQSTTEIRGIDVKNTVDAPSHGNGGKSGLTTSLPNKLPFD